MSYQSTKVWGPISCAFRQAGASHSHCRFVHGYGLTFKAVFEAKELDERNWVMDFGGLKPIKAWLEDTFDHRLVVSRHDPLLSEFRELEAHGACQITVLANVGCEAFARHAGLYVQQWLNDQEWNNAPGDVVKRFGHYAYNRVNLHSMECREHENNSAIWIREP